MAPNRPFTLEQVVDANKTYADWHYYYFGGKHKWRVYEEGTCLDPALIGKPLYEKPAAVHFLRFLNEVVWTLDEDDDETPLKTFPRHKNYIYYYVEKILFTQRFIVIPKSRRMMMTWIHAAYVVWFSLANPRRNIIWQAQKGEKVADTMENKILHIMKSFPLNRFAPFVDVNDPRIPAGWDDRIVNWFKGKRQSYGLTRIAILERDDWLTGGTRLTNGSHILGVPEGADQTRQYTITLFIGDEFAFWKKPKASLKGVRPALGRNGQGILVSSASPGYMQELIEKPLLEPGAKEPPSPLPFFEGIQTWYSKQGWFVAWVHYTADEEKRSVEWTQWPDPGKAVGEGDPGYARLGMSQRDWKQEYEIDFSVHQGEPFYPEYSDAVHRQPVRAIPGQPLILGFDFGLTPATVICQLTRSGHLNVIDEFVSEDSGISQHAELLVAYLDNNYGWWRGGQRARGGRRDITAEDFYRPDEEEETQEMLISYVDPAGFQRAQTDMVTPIQILKRFGLNPVGSVQDVVARSESVKELLGRSLKYPSRGISLPALMVNDRAKMLLEAFRGGAKQGKLRFKKEKNEFSHIMEALEYVCVMLTSVERRLARKNKKAATYAPFVQQPSKY